MRLQKRLAGFMAGTMIFTAMPVWASDYNNHWAKNAIDTWSANGVVAGYEDGTFKPNQQVTRAELTSFIVRVFGLSDVSNAKTYKDVASTKWYAGAIAAASSAGIVNDDETNFRPDDYATREETAYILANAFELTGGTLANFKDQTSVSDWAYDQFSALVGSGVIKGRTNATGALLAAPKDAVTRAEVVQMLDRLTAAYYNAAGTYTGTINGNVVINTQDVVLKDATITGNLYIAEGVGSGDVVLDNTTIQGNLIIEGGGENSVKLTNGSKAPRMKVEKADSKVRVVIDKTSTVETMTVESGVKIDGNVGSVEVKSAKPVEILSGVIQTLTVTTQAKGVSITVSVGVEVKQAIVEVISIFLGQGKIETVTLKANDVSFERKPSKIEVPTGVTVDKVVIGGVTQAPTTSSSSSSSGGGSSSSSSSSDSTDTDDDSSDSTTVTTPSGLNVTVKDLTSGAAMSLTSGNVYYIELVPQNGTFTTGSSIDVKVQSPLGNNVAADKIDIENVKVATDGKTLTFTLKVKNTFATKELYFVVGEEYGKIEVK